MYWQNNKGNQSQNQQNRHSGDMSPFSGDSGGGTPFRSPHHRPRYQSSPRYHPQFNSPFPDPYRMPAGAIRPPQRSPHPSQSPRHDFSYSPQGGNMDSPYHGDNRRMSGGRGRGGRHHHHHHHQSGGRDFSSHGDCNPGGSSDISQYYSPDMLQDPWERLTPVPSEKT